MMKHIISIELYLFKKNVGVAIWQNHFLLKKYPFLIEYRAKLNDILRYDVSLMRYRIDELSRSLFAYRNELRNKDNNPIK